MGVDRNILIPLRDGETVAADLYLPDDAGPVPAVLTYYPYRKDDYIGAYAGSAVEYFADHGYASLLADFRGLGNSSGKAWDAFDAREAEDGVDIVQWIAEQPWCDGNVGMWGMSYGGITSFKTAAERPPALKAIVPIMGSLDIYSDWFYPGGCLNCLGASLWGASMLALQLMPPMFHDPEGRWYEVWLERLERSEPYMLPWRRHRDRDDFWQSREIDAGKIDIPTFLIGSWRDIFPQLMVNAYEQIDAPRRLLMGPWTHTFPDLDEYEQYDYLHEMRVWWDRWLKGSAPFSDAEPPVSIFVQGSDGWRHEDEWPIARTEERTLYLGPDGGFREEAGEAGEVVYSADPTVGVAAGLWDPMSLGIGRPLDQSDDDLRSLTFTGEPLAEPLEITGSPIAHIEASLEDPGHANVVVKLCDVAPDDSSTLITTGWLNVAHRQSHEEARPIEPGEPATFPVQLWATSYELPAGHRLRVSISCSDFPRIWPTRRNPCLTVSLGGERPSRVELPAVPPGGRSMTPPRPDPSVNRAPLVIDFEPYWRIERDQVGDSASVTTGMRWMSSTPAGDGRLALDQTAKATVARERPDGARVEEQTCVSLVTPGGSEVEVETRSWQTLAGFALSGRVLVDGRPMFEKEWRG